MDEPLEELVEDEMPQPLSSAVLWGPSLEVRVGGRDANGILKRERVGHKRLRDQVNEAIGAPATSKRDALISLVAESDLHAFEARRSSKRWRRAYFILGLPAAILAGVSGGTGLASPDLRIAAGIIALVSAGLGAAVTFLDSDSRASVQDQLSAGWQRLADDARMEVLKISTSTSSDDRLTDSVLLLLHRRKSRLLRGDFGDGEYPELLE